MHPCNTHSIPHEEQDVQVATPTYSTYELSIVSFTAVNDKHRLLRATGNNPYAQHWKEVPKDHNDPTGSKKWIIDELREKIKISPAVTQAERRIEAPFHALMNALTAAFPAFKGKQVLQAELEDTHSGRRGWPLVRARRVPATAE